MNLGDLYDRSVELGIQKDPRGRARIERHLANLRAQYESLGPAEKENFDTERLTNPFGDVRIVVGDRASEFDTILAGIQIEAPALDLGSPCEFLGLDAAPTAMGLRGRG